MDHLKIYQGYLGHKNRFFVPSFGTRSKFDNKHKTRRSFEVPEKILKSFVLGNRTSSCFSSNPRACKETAHQFPIAIFMKTTSGLKENDKLITKKNKRKNFSLNRNRLCRRSIDAEIQNVSSHSLAFYNRYL